MEEIDGFEKLSNLTSRTIISGKQRKDETIVRGLYKKIDGKVLLITELSQILTKIKMKDKQSSHNSGICTMDMRFQGMESKMSQ